MGAFSIDPQARMGPVNLKVSDIGKSIEFYESFLCLKIVEKTPHAAFLSPDGNPPYLVAISKAKSSASQKRTGLYHFAILLPQRKDLGDFLSNLLKHKDGVKVDGFADHLVSESVYIRDPDNIGIEIYRDRPEPEWKWDGTNVRMAVDPLDVQGLLAESEKPWTEFPAKTIIGHVHLHVANLAGAKRFYSEALGLSNTASVHGALFFAAGKYHHHIATNVWLGQNVQRASRDSPGLDYFTIKFSSKDRLYDVIRHLESNRIAANKSKDAADSFDVSDGDGISIRLA